MTSHVESQVSVLEGVKPDQIPFDKLLQADGPVILRGLVSGWGLVQAGKQSPDNAMQMLQSHSSGKPVGVYIAPPETKARFFYNHDCTGFNYQSKYLELAEIFAQIRDNKNNPERSYCYMNSLTLDECFPGLREQNNLSFNHSIFANNKPLSKVWVGTESIAAAHYDVPSNLACCVLGARRFTLFPPEQIHNLYPGPLEPTPGGQVISMVDLKNPDLQRFPRVREALEAAVVVDLQPGDAVYYPSMWWHQVEALSPFNIMINFWWLTAPAYMGNPLDIVMHAIMGLRDRSEAEKKAWREVFDYYVFGSPETPREHLPPAIQGALADLDNDTVRRLRALVKNKLNR
ncbi:MAG: cupin-like domain-containing protein [Porticoccaceae bacterium]|nr:cupin-like domain-containing protein [Porticoccaceae bacterium]